MTEPIRILRVIARLNTGGPAIHVTLATAGLATAGYHTRLLAGDVADGESSMEWFAEEHGVRVERVDGLGREIRLRDAGVVRALSQVLRDWRPHLVHTHTAKAGAVGRAAALTIRLSRRPKLVHTFHGHVLSGYFGAPKQAAFRAIERGLARRTDRLVVPGARLRDELLALGVGRAEQYAVIPLGFDLSRFLAIEADSKPAGRGATRSAHGIPEDAFAIGIVGRLTRVKNHRLMVDAFARMPPARVPAILVVVGDGELRGEIEAWATTRGVADRVRFTGRAIDMPAIYRALDLVAISSDAEGTPVALIEAMASARPVVSTDVGAVRDIVEDRVHGIVVPPRDAVALAAALGELANDASLRRTLGAAGRRHAEKAFGSERLLRDLDALYRSILDG